MESTYIACEMTNKKTDIDQVRLKPNREKIAECLLFLIDRAQRKARDVTQFDLVKTLFIADAYHIEKYGRPITFDNYVAMKNGPVASEAYDMLKETYEKSHLIDGWPLWRRERKKARTYRYYGPSRSPNLRKLAKTDLGELKAAQDAVWSLGFNAVSDLTHEHIAYKNAWRKDLEPERHAFSMSYRDLLPDRDEELLSEIAFASRHAK